MGDDTPAWGEASVQSSWADACFRVCGEAFARAPPRFTTAVLPSSATPSKVVPAGKEVLAAPWSQVLFLGPWISAVTRLVTRAVGEVPMGTNTESGTSTGLGAFGLTKYRSCGL